MDSVALWINSDDEHEERLQRRFIRDHSDVMAISDKSFVKNFRLNKEAFMYVLQSITCDLKVAQRSTAIPPIIKLAATLKFLAQGGYQHQIGQDRFVGLAQQTMSSCLFEVCTAIERKLCPKHISFKMSEMEKREAKIFFHEKSSIPGIIGAVDGTHIQIIRPSRNEHLYFNRKLKHSINAMVICDHKLKIMSVNGRFGGASHDSHVWNLSGQRQYLKEKYENGHRGTWILGDSGYPLEPWILTPYRNVNENSTESLFNDKFSKARSIIERVFGILKGRFRCLLSARELHYAPEKAAQILNVCCALHNICLIYNVDIPTDLPILEEDEETPFNENFVENVNLTNIAKQIRDEIKNNIVA